MSWAASLLFTTIICSLINPIRCSSDDTGVGLARVCFGNSTDSDTKGNVDFEDNVYSLLFVLITESSSMNPPLRFFNTSVGRYSDRAYGSYLCRGDLSAKQCHHCVQDVKKFMSDLEIDHSECFAFDLNARCIIRYGNSSKLSTYEEGRLVSYRSIGPNVTNYEQYNETLSTTLEGLIREAEYGTWTETNFATTAVEVAGSHEKIYVLAQCAPDISSINCGKCLGELYSRLPDCCNGTQGGVLAHANCLMKFDNETFFGSASHNLMPGYLHVTLVMLLIMYTFL